MRCFEKTHECTHLLNGAGVCTEIVTCHIGKAEFVFGRKFPSQIKLDALANLGGFSQKLGRCRFLKFQKHIGAFDLDPFAAVQFHLNRSFCF